MKRSTCAFFFGFFASLFLVAFMDLWRVTQLPGVRVVIPAEGIFFYGTMTAGLIGMFVCWKEYDK